MTNVKQQSTELFQPAVPQREWLMRCTHPEPTMEFELAVCSVMAEAGEIVIVDTEEQPVIRLVDSQIGGFRAALDDAIAVAAADVEARRKPAR